MKIIYSSGNYTNGVRVVQLKCGKVQKLLMFTKNGNPSQEVLKEWESFEEYNNCESTKSAKIDLDKIFKNW